jgi:NADP-dependent 3-hydroxy acid dehydrogenase YdfG
MNSHPVVLITGALTGIGRATAVASHHQYPELFIEHATLFLNG